ncbi:MAG: radical SAM protein, partial [Clostridia bacterium]|nr:radical SAM protein [Clostridia bacterium]
MNASSIATRFGLKTAFDYIGKDPEKNLPKLMKWVDWFAGDGPNSFEKQRDVVRRVVNDPENNMYKLLVSLYDDLDPNVLKTVFENFVLNANLKGWPIQEEMRKKYECNIPWTILLDPTSAC